ncbi:hypothetical protein MP638_004146 [Amoeboaphelidium occidentale]|nr:hypothetical protein MP638_004146 [Amoeboaphelidium occidentale]
MNSLDLLKAEIARKRKAAEAFKQYEQGAQEPAKKPVIEDRRTKMPESNVTQNKSNKISETEAEPTSPSTEIPEDELIKRFRARSEPIRLFGESPKERVQRLKRAEALHRQADQKGQRNKFKDTQAKVDQELQLELLQNGIEVEKSNDETDGDRERRLKMEVINKFIPDFDKIGEPLRKSNSSRCYELVYVFFKKLLLDWDVELTKRPAEIRQSDQGKNETAIYKQTVENLKVFFKLAKKHSLPDDVYAKVVEIVFWIHRKEYVKANDAYLRMSIGNACWPIGVTNIGIHERKSRDKISTDQVAHVLNDETTRKWIQGIKRLMTFAQKLNPPDDPSKAIG